MPPTIERGAPVTGRQAALPALPALPALAAAAGLSLLGCVGSIEGPSAVEDPGVPPPGASTGGERTPTGGSRPAIADPPDTAAPPLAELVEPVGLRRLTRREYNEVVAFLLEDGSRPATLLLPEDPLTPFDNGAEGQIPSNALVEGTETLAKEASARLLSDAQRRDRVVGCTPEGPTDADCLRRFIQRVGRRALRRSLAEPEVKRLMDFQAFAEESGDFYQAVDAVLRVLLQHPELLYRFELGEPVPDQPGLARLPGMQLASRISFLLWGTTPDDRLLDLAEKGALETPRGISALADEMMADPRAREMTARFHGMWMTYDPLPHPEDLARPMEAEVRALLDRTLFERKQPWRELFRSEETYVTPELARHYGLPPPTSGKAGWIPYQGRQGRRGMLSQGAFLSVGASGGDSSVIRRGLAIQRLLLCREIPEPPDLPADPEKEAAIEAAVCKADKLQIHNEPGCAACHKLIDPAGLGLESFDHLGRHRTHEAEHPECAISGQGRLDGIGEFRGPAELQQLLVDSGRLEACLTTQLLRFALGRAETTSAAEKLSDAVLERFRGAAFTWPDLLRAIVADPAFRHTRVEE
jgi:hypothetical protein